MHARRSVSACRAVLRTLPLVPAGPRLATAPSHRRQLASARPAAAAASPAASRRTLTSSSSSSTPGASDDHVASTSTSPAGEAAVSSSSTATGSAATEPAPSPDASEPAKATASTSSPAGAAAAAGATHLAERYFALWPQTALEPLIQTALSETLSSAAITGLPDSVREAIGSQLTTLPERFATASDRPPRVVLMHHTDPDKDPASAQAWRQVWDKLARMGHEPDSPDYTLAFDYAVFDANGLALTVESYGLREGDALAEADPDLWSLPAGGESRFSLSVLHPPRQLPNGSYPSLASRLEHTPNLAAVFRHHLLAHPADRALAAGAFELNGYNATFVRLAGLAPAVVAKFAPKWFDDRVFHAYSCPSPRTGPPPPARKEPLRKSAPPYGLHGMRPRGNRSPPRSRDDARPSTKKRGQAPARRTDEAGARKGRGGGSGGRARGDGGGDSDRP